MKSRRVILVLALALILLLANVAQASAMPPTFPSSYYGTITGVNIQITPGMEVTARIDGVAYAQTSVVSSGPGGVGYALDIPADDPETTDVIEGGRANDLVTIYVGDHPATPGVTWLAGTNRRTDITVRVNHAPAITTPKPAALNLAEDTPGGLTLAAADVDGDALTWSVLTQGSKGTASFPAGTGDSKLFTYTPVANANGSDSFVAQVADGDGASDTILVNVTIAAVNDTPAITTIKPAALNIAEDTPGTLTLAAADVDGDALTWSVLTQGSKGTASFPAGTGNSKLFTYTPAADANGSDSFVAQVADADGASDTILVNVTIAAVNDAPVITTRPAAITTAEDTPGSVDLAAADVEGDALTWSLIEPAARHGQTVITGSGAAISVTYTPEADFYGTDSFGAQVSDGHGGVDVLTVSVTVSPVNDAPVCSDASLTIDQDQSKTVAPVCVDLDSAGLTYQIAAQPGHGLATVAGDLLSYTPSAGFIGEDSFTYTASDGQATSNIASVAVTVLAVQHAPLIDQGASTQVSMSEDGSPKAFALTLSASDQDGDTLTWSITPAAQHGVAAVSGSGSSKAIAYTPTANYNGTDSFGVRVSDGHGNTAVITVSVTIDPVNDAPILENVPSQSVVVGNLLAFQVVASDVDGDPLTYSLVDAPQGAALDAATGAFTWTPDAVGEYTFTIRVTDGQTPALSAEAQVTVQVKPAGPDVPGDGYLIYIPMITR